MGIEGTTRSVFLFSHFRDRLAFGLQPGTHQLKPALVVHGDRARWTCMLPVGARYADSEFPRVLVFTSVMRCKLNLCSHSLQACLLYKAIKVAEPWVCV